MRRIAETLLLACLLASLCFVAQSQARSDLENRVHKAIMDEMTEYTKINRTKVMSICIGKNPSKSVPYDFENVFWSYTAEYSDIPIFATKLEQHTLNRCKGWAAKEHKDCDCYILDKNGKNVLELP